MSRIMLRGEDVNSLVYKYLLEQGFTHTAYLFEREAAIDSEALLAKRLQPYLLTSIIEKGMLLRYLELHTDQEETRVCSAPYSLFEEHSCDLVEKAFLGKRELRKQHVLEIAREVKESLMMVDNETAANVTPDDKLPVQFAKSKSLAANPKKEKPLVEEASQTKPVQSKEVKKEREASKPPQKEAQEEPVQPTDMYARIEAKDVDTAFLSNNFEVVETYYDGLGTYLLLKIKDGSVSCYMIALQNGSILAPQFILPTEYIQSSQWSLSVLLRKHLILVSDQGEMTFINYSLRFVQNITKFSQKPPKAIIHSYQLSVYIIICEKKTYIVDDVNFTLKREVAGAFEGAAACLGGRIALLGDNNQVQVIDLEDKNYALVLNTGEVAGFNVGENRGAQVLDDGHVPDLQDGEPVRGERVAAGKARKPLFVQRKPQVLGLPGRRQ